jgi:amino acid transporter
VTLRQLLLGKPLRNDQQGEEQIGALSGVPVLGLDAIASSAYGPEAALTAMLAVGAAGSVAIVPISGAILIVLFLVFISYRQTIAAYPHGGGSFTVAKENLGARAGVVAASALCVDYVLNAAVAISAGVGAIVSAIPSLLPFTLTLTLVILALLTLINLRGIRSTSWVLAMPTYAFVGCLATAIGIGLVRAALGQPPLARPATTTHAAVEPVTTWLLLRAFASGCTALTGVEAVSNGVPLFREPKVTEARRTLLLIVAILAILLAGIAVLVRVYGITATEPGQTGYQSIVSQVVAASTGRGLFFLITTVTALMVLAMSANTSFADFPRVCHMLAADHFLPSPLARRGPRLVFSGGILVLAALTAALLIAFGGVTDRLIPLFAVGAFLAFTMSQLGMVAHWRRSTEPGRHRRLILNATGAAATGVSVLIITVAKFTEGAWLTALVIPVLVWLFLATRRYHDRISQETTASGVLDVSHLTAPIVLIPTRRLDRVTRKALRFAVTIASDVRVVQVQADEIDLDNLAEHWSQWVDEPMRRLGHPPVCLVTLRSPYREFYDRLLDWIHEVAVHNRSRMVLVIIPELVQRRWYQFLLSQRATRLKGRLLLSGVPNVAVMNTPWYATESREDRP